MNDRAPTNADRRARPGVGERTLGLTATALAATLAALLLARPAPTAQAGDVSRAGDFVALTADDGAGEDILATIDQRTETLLLYAASRTRLELLQAYDLRLIFTAARSAARR
ncbi:MAG: hypothetical protein D6824_09245 [Planctomycetota bacterium]|nr:MAG: hypothetical protein D6824_09245 [Planctomycetota bacterium]